MQSNQPPERLRVLRFGAVGLMNTALGYSVILTGLALGWGDIASNAAGYATGLFVGFLLNKQWTFRSKADPGLGEGSRYAQVFLVAYCANLTVLVLARSFGFVESPLAQLAGIGVYSVLFYLGSSRYVFMTRSSPEASSSPDTTLRSRER